MSEKRRHPRRVVRVPVMWTAANGVRAEGHSRDMSLGGMFIETNSPAPFGASVSLVMILPGKHEISVKATVRWTEPDGMGVQFGLMGARDTHAITQLLLGAPVSVR